MNLAESQPRVSIGILAHNEESNIAETLQSLFAQDVFQHFPTEIVIVANGCFDNTAAIATRILTDNYRVWSEQGTARVEDIATPGKANAWNEFVHRFSATDASILVLMDADIAFLNTNTISSMVATLRSSPRAVVCVDRPVKDIELRKKRRLLERLLVAATPKISSDNVPLCGQLYCAFSAQLRLITLPLEIIGEDGFLRALLLTKGFTEQEDLGQIVLDSSVAHSFKSVATLREMFKHEKWLISGTIVNTLLFELFWAKSSVTCSAMSLMQEWHARDPDWLARYIRAQVDSRGWKLLPREYWTRRWARLRGRSAKSLAIRFPVAVIAAAVDLIIFVAAISDVRRGRAFHYWGRGELRE